VDRRIAGVRYKVKLQAHDPQSTIVKLREWEADPAGWSPHGKTPTAPVYLTPELVAAYVAWCCEVPDGKARRRNTDSAWVAKKKRYLADLAGQLVGRNLRNDGTVGCLTTDDLRDLLAGKAELPAPARGDQVVLRLRGRTILLIELRHRDGSDRLGHLGGALRAHPDAGALLLPGMPVTASSAAAAHKDRRGGRDVQVFCIGYTDTVYGPSHHADGLRPVPGRPRPRPGRGRVLRSLHRADLLKSKLFALCDRGLDLPDCIALAPTPAELAEATTWLGPQDLNPEWPTHVRATLGDLARRLGHGP
jgi:hypothetical protein